MRRFSSGRRSSAPAALTVLAVLALLVWPFCALCVTGLSACRSSGEASNETGLHDASSEVTSVCDEFTEVGAPCSAASSVACFPMCEAGGCFCRVMPGVGPRWVCVTDTTCLPDCAPADESCGAQSDGSAEAETEAEAEAEAAPPREAGE